MQTQQIGNGGLRLVDEKTAARYIAMSVHYLRLDRCEGHRGNRTPGPPYLKIGKAVRYDIADLDAWIDAHKRARVS
jgi:hypothetical protein